MIYLVYTNNLWVMGELEKSHGAVYFNNPRMYIFNGNQHGIANLPGGPDRIEIVNYSFMYGINEELLDLYNKQVKQEVIIKPVSDIRIIQ